MIFYKFDYNTKEFLGECEISPNDNGEYDILPDVTPFPPPPKLNGLVIVYNMDKIKWEYTEDHRGEVWLDGNGNRIIIEFIGHPVVDGFLIQRENNNV